MKTQKTIKAAAVPANDKAPTLVLTDDLVDCARIAYESVRTSVDNGCTDTPGLWIGITKVSRAIREAAGQKEAAT